MKNRWGKLFIGTFAGALLGIMGVQQGGAAPIDTHIKVDRGQSQFVIQFNQEAAPQIALTLVHLAKKGDTVWSIADKYGVSVNELLKINRLNVKQPLLINQRLIVPVKPKPAIQSKGQKQVQLYLFVDEKDAPLAKKSNESQSMKSHLVKNGETIYSLAKKYKITEEELRQANGLTANSYLLIGQTLKVPQITYHSVKSGETLTQISRKYHTSVQKLLMANALEADEHIIPGQKLKIVN